METLGNEALGKIMNIVGEAKLPVELDAGRSCKRPQISILNILQDTQVGTYTGPAPGRADAPVRTPQHDDVRPCCLCFRAGAFIWSPSAELKWRPAR